MNEEKFSREEADELTLLITDRLGARSEKLERMAEWDKLKRRKFYLRSAVALVAAACVAVVFVLVPMTRADVLDGMPLDPAMEQYRTASPELTEVATMIDNGEYGTAQSKIESLIASYSKELETLTEADDAESEYERQELVVVISDLRWAEICCLLKEKKYNDAKELIPIYIKDVEIAAHLEEAKEILKKIQ